MDTRSGLRRGKGSSEKCVYCGKPADSRDHAPPHCLLRPPLPSNVITLPACKKCNSGFSFAENVVRAILTLTSNHADLAPESEIGGRVRRALERDRRLSELVDGCRRY